MMAETAAARVKEGDREVSNGARLVRRAIWPLLAAGACLLLSLAAGGRAASPRQVSTRDKPENRASGKPRNDPKPRSTPKTLRPTPTATPALDDHDIFENIRLKIVISGGVPARGMNVTIWSRERDMPAIPQPLKGNLQQDGAYVINLQRGLDRRKDYWVTVTSADERLKRLSGEAVVSLPDDDNPEVPISITLYRAVTFNVFTRREGDGPRREGTLSVVEKGQELSSSVPYELGSDGKVSFDKGLKPGTEYVLLTSDGDEFLVNPDVIKNDVIRIDLPALGLVSGTFIRVSTEEGHPLRDAKVSITLNDDESQIHSKMTDEQGVVPFKADARKVRTVAVETRGSEIYSCGRADEAACPEPVGAGTIFITLGDASQDWWIVSALQSATGIVFVIAAVVIMGFGVASYRILLKPEPPPAPAPSQQAVGWSAPAPPKITSEVAIPAGAETSLRADGLLGAQGSSATPAQYEVASTDGKDAAAQLDQSHAVQAYTVPNSLSAEMAKEAYGRWMRKEKLTRNPLRLDLVLVNSTNDQVRLLKETNDPGSKFILFTNGEGGGWLFPNPARSVFQTEVEQTWRLVFNGLSKEEFGRKTDKLNPVEARRADGAEGRGMWVAEQTPYEFS